MLKHVQEEGNSLVMKKVTKHFIWYLTSSATESPDPTFASIVLQFCELALPSIGNQNVAVPEIVILFVLVPDRVLPLYLMGYKGTCIVWD